MENFGYAAIATAIVALMIGAFFGGIWVLMRRANNDPVSPPPYPFDDPNFVHVGMTPRQLAALQPIAMELRFMQWIPHHANAVIDCTYYAMTREEFITFFGVVTRHTRLLMAKAAKEAMRNDAIILEGDAFVLSEMLIGLTEIRQKLLPEPVPAELMIPLKPPVDSAPA